MAKFPATLIVPAEDYKRLESWIQAVADDFRARNEKLLIEGTLEKELRFSDSSGRLYSGEREVRALLRKVG